jgi:hypothetical protein
MQLHQVASCVMHCSAQPIDADNTVPGGLCKLFFLQALPLLELLLPISGVQRFVYTIATSLSGLRTYVALSSSCKRCHHRLAG